MSLTQDIKNLPSSLVENNTNHLRHHTVIHAALKNHINRLASVEAMNGVTPESPVDGQTANLVAQPDSLTHAAIFGQFAEDPPGSGLFLVPGGM